MIRVRRLFLPLILLLLITLFIVLFPLAKTIYLINTTESVPIGLYRIRIEETPGLGDFVAFDSSSFSAVFAQQKTLIKYVRGVPGDVVSMNDEGLVVRGVLYELQPGIKIRACPEGPIPSGYYYLGSDHPRGLDSRYFGLVPITKLQYLERRGI